MKRALITGISGQDGCYLAQWLLAQGYEVHGTSRRPVGSPILGLRALALEEKVSIHSVSLTDQQAVRSVLENIAPDEVYNLSGQSSVGRSFEYPMETIESIALATLTLLEALRHLKSEIRLFCASSSECFGRIDDQIAADENTRFAPLSPYAVAKATAYWHTVNYRDTYGLHASSGIMFNHESPLRPDHFVTQKIISTAVRIADGSGETLQLGDTSVKRDWGWAPEYVEGMWRMLQQDNPGDFVLATGKAHTLAEFVAAAFDMVGLNWKDHVTTDEDLGRPGALSPAHGNADKAKKILGWEAKLHMADVVRGMVRAKQADALTPSAKY